MRDGVWTVASPKSRKISVLSQKPESTRKTRQSGLKGRYGIFLFLAAIYAAFNLTTRLALLFYEGDSALYGLSAVLKIVLIGLLYDAASLSWILLLFAVNALIWPNSERGRKAHQWVATALFSAGLFGLLFQMLAEFLFWNEFSSRFNFIAVDYLVYTREVIGNIWQSYPIEYLLLGLGVAFLAAIAIFGPAFYRTAHYPAPALRTRAAISLAMAALPVLVFFGLGEGPHRILASPAERELASNGLYSLFRAFRNNDLDYKKFYAVLPADQIVSTLEEELSESHAKQAKVMPDGAVVRHITPAGAPIRKNVVLISIESLGSDYVEAFGGRKGLTPNLSRLAKESLTFHNLFSTGLRTVRGLEAITLSIPPTPGRAVPIRERNKGLMSIGSVFKQQGYSIAYLYGGYSLFDNMKDFFSGNGYEVRDRTDIDSDKIDHETIWGVADEDLFEMAIDELDRRAAQPSPFFVHIMTTSNHRPYTYPDNRIDIPSHSGRDGAVKYTDWAIGKFLKEAAEKPWFSDTVFVILSDHTSHGRGRIDLPPENYRIPLWIYAPGFIKPGRIDAVASQIDVAPTLLGLLNIPYLSNFFGQDILSEGRHHQHAFMANYLTVGYMENDLIVELAPQGRVRVVRVSDGSVVPSADPEAQHMIKEAISYYQTAASYISKNTRSE